MKANSLRYLDAEYWDGAYNFFRDPRQRKSWGLDISPKEGL